MAKETKEERRARIEKQVADASAARRQKYFESQAAAKTEATATMKAVPTPDAYVYTSVWRQDAGGTGGRFSVIKTANPYYDPATNTVTDPVTGVQTPAGVSMTTSDLAFSNNITSVAGKSITSATRNADGTYTVRYSDGTSQRVTSDGKAVTSPTTVVTNPNTTVVTNPNTTIVTNPNTTVVTNPNTTVVNTNSSNAELIAVINSLQNTIANLTSKSTTDTAAAQAAQDLKERQSAFDVLYQEMDALGLAALVEPLRGLIQKNVSPSEFAVELRQSEAYKMRFAANEVRLKKGLRVLGPGEYIRIEDAYRQTLRAYGLKQFDNDEYVRQFIENDISSAELSDRVAMAVQRVQNADPAVTRTLRDYYGIGQQDLVAYVLDPNQQLPKIQRQIAAAEIGTAARRQGLEPGVGVSEQLAAQGITEAEAQRGYATIANILPTAEKLSQIYGATMEGYDMAQAEQEVFNQLASAQRRRERLTQREIAQFSGQSGLGRTSLASENRGQF